MATHPPVLARAMALFAGLALTLQTGCSDRELPMGTPQEHPAFAQVETAPVVNSLNDPGTGGCDDTECTLREAIDFASPGATITFTPGFTGTITLSSELSPLYLGLSIIGPGADKLTLVVNGSDGSPRRGLVVYSTAFVSGLTITGGYADAGGGIWNAGTLTLSNMVVTGNHGETGGGIYSSGTLTVSHSTVSSNTSTSGGGISNQGTLTVEHSTISGNTASSFGMGVGGGISAAENWADETAVVTTTVRNSTISGNMAACRGGGIDNMRRIRIEHTTITGNTVGRSDHESGCGGGGLHSYLVTGDASVGAEVVGSILWGNFEVGVPEDVAANVDLGVFTSLGHNLIGAAGYGVVFSEDFAATGDQTGVSDAGLGALALNAPGTTATHALLDGSPALDAGTCTGLDDATVADDQRGVVRPQGSACDIGAYERIGAAPPSSFTSACTYTVHPKNGSYVTTVSWSNADPGVTWIAVTDGRTITKQMAPTATGSWSTTVRSGVPSYEIWGGLTRKDASTELKTSTECTAEAGG